MARASASLLVTLLVVSFACQALAAFTMGGASTFKTAAAGIIAGYKGPGPMAAYDSVGSGDGIAGFNSGKYIIAVSDDPMTAAQEKGAPAKFTVPLCVSTFTFFVNGASGVVLTAKQTFGIYSGTIRQWSAVSKLYGPLGKITPISRSDKSGSTAIVKIMWSKAVPGYKGGKDGAPMTYPGLKPVEGTSAVCAAVLATKGAIGYAFTGGCTVVNGKRAYASLVNANGVAVSPKAWDPKLAIPGKPPLPFASWAGVDFIWKAGRATPPMVSMEYGFIRQAYTKAKGGAVAKAFMQFMVAQLNKNAYGFTPLPASWYNGAVAAVAKVKVT